MTGPLQQFEAALLEAPERRNQVAAVDCRDKALAQRLQRNVVVPVQEVAEVPLQFGKRAESEFILFNEFRQS